MSIKYENFWLVKDTSQLEEVLTRLNEVRNKFLDDNLSPRLRFIEIKSKSNFDRYVKQSVFKTWTPEPSWWKVEKYYSEFGTLTGNEAKIIFWKNKIVIQFRINAKKSSERIRREIIVPLKLQDWSYEVQEPTSEIVCSCCHKGFHFERKKISKLEKEKQQWWESTLEGSSYFPWSNISFTTFHIFSFDGENLEELKEWFKYYKLPQEHYSYKPPVEGESQDGQKDNESFFKKLKDIFKS